jgi:hypothetical protein
MWLHEPFSEVHDLYSVEWVGDNEWCVGKDLEGSCSLLV